MTGQTFQTAWPAAARWLRCTLAALLPVFVAASVHADTRVLVLASDPHSSPGLALIDAPMRRAIETAVHEPVEIDEEHLDLVYTNTSEVLPSLVDFLHTKYRDRQPGFVVTLGSAALRFALDQKPVIFPHAQILFGHVLQSDLAGLRGRNDVAGVVSDWGYDKEVETVLRLLPDTRHIIVILGNGPLERAYEPVLRASLRHAEQKLGIEWWVGLPMREMEKRIAHLPPDSAVVYVGVYRDGSGAALVPVAVAERLSGLSSVPMFGAFAHWVGIGVVGDGRFSYDLLGQQIGEDVVRLLRGETPSALGIVPARVPPLTFDARQLVRWQIPTDRLPAGSQLRFNTPSLWEQHRTAVLVVLAVILFEAALVTALVAQRIGRKRAEVAESESQLLYTSVADSLDERVATISRNGTIVNANRAWRSFAHSHDDAPLDVGMNYLDAIRKAIDRGQKDAQRTFESLSAVLSGRDSSRRLEYFSPGNGDRWRYEMRIASLQRAGGGALVTISDITDRWQSEERVRVALESLPFATFLLDAAGTIELVNGEAERLFDYPRAELFGRPLSLLIPAFKATAEGSEAWVRQDRLKEVPTTATNRNGTELPVILSLLNIVMTSRTMIIACIQDMSERRRLDAELQRVREEMAHFGRVATVGEMSAAIAHELNQPLAGIMMNCQAAQRLLQGGSFTQADVVETFSDIVADARRAGEVIQRLRMMLRKKAAEVRPLDLNDTVKQVQLLIAHDLAMRGAALDLELTEDLPLIVGDRIHLQQVILNLILNAADAMATLPPESRHMVLRTRPGINHTVELELRDSGPGISVKTMPHIFEPFFTTKPNGMGMGLSIVRSIVETHGGRITCANAASGGAVFNVILPAREREVAA